MSDYNDPNPRDRFRSHRADSGNEPGQRTRREAPAFETGRAPLGPDRIAVPVPPRGRGSLPPIDVTDPRQPIRQQMVVGREDPPMRPPEPMEDPLLDLKRSALRIGVWCGVLGCMTLALIMILLSAVIVGHVR